MERRAVAIHEAGHAVAGHVYLTGRESTRLTIKKRGDQGVGGHHWMIEKEERLFSFQHEMFHDIVWGLGAMAAERVVYGENSNGVGGDVAGVTARAALMVGRAAMGPQPFHVTPRDGETRGAGAQARARPLREDRAPDHDPRRRRRAVRRRSDRRRARRSGEADGRGADPRPGATSRPTTSRSLNRAGIERDRGRARGASSRSWATSCSTCSTRRSISDPRDRPRRRGGLASARVLGGDRPRWPRDGAGDTRIADRARLER